MLQGFYTVIASERQKLPVNGKQLQTTWGTEESVNQNARNRWRLCGEWHNGATGTWTVTGMGCHLF